MQQQQQETNKGIIIAVVHTNSTGKLAPLDGMILAGQVEFRPDESRLITLWEWESGIPLPTTMKESPSSPMNVTTSTTDATATETNATTMANEEEQQE